MGIHRVVCKLLDEEEAGEIWDPVARTITTTTKKAK
jgi:hypothetical protein